MQVKVFENHEALSRAAADLFVELASKSIAEFGRFAVALSGGHTPVEFYNILSSFTYASRIEWNKVHIFWGDERCVPMESPESNSGEASRLFLDSVPIPKNQIHPISGTLPPAESASEYEKTLRDFFGDNPPRFDLIFLGLGANGHTASLFPDSDVLGETDRLVSGVIVDELKSYRVTLTVPVINQARTIAFLVSGGDKANVLHEVLDGPYQPEHLPAQLIRAASGEVLWLVDKAAAASLKRN